MANRAENESKTPETAHPKPSTDTASSAASRPSRHADGALPNRCGDDCVRPTPSQAHCGARSCGRTFGGVKGFDAHRKDGNCLDPAMLGMVRNDAGVWRTPMTDEDRARRFPAAAAPVTDTTEA